MNQKGSDVKFRRRFKMNQKRILMFSLVFAVVISNMWAGGQRDDKPTETSDQELEAPRITLKAGHNQVPEYPHGVILHRFAEEVNQSDLNVTIEVFDNSLLGSEDQMFQGMMAGAVDIAKISPAQAASVVPAFDALSLPYMMDTSEQMFKVLEGPIGQQLAADLEEKAGVKILAWMDQGSRNFYTVDTPVRKPEDLKGLKIRAINSPVMVATINAFGAAATPLSFGELYTAFKQKVVDGAENSPDAIYYAKHYEVAKYLCLTHHFRMPVMLCISMKSYEKLTEEQQKLIVDLAEKVAEENKGLYQEESDRLLQEMADNGLTVIDDVDIEAFKQLVEPVYAKFEDTVGKDIIDAIRATQ